MNPATSLNLRRRLRRRGHQIAEPTDEQLRDAFSDYGSDLYRYSLSIVHRPADAEDVLQTTMVKAAEQLAKEGELQLRPWLYRVTHNESISLLRRRRRARSADVDPDEVAAIRSNPAATAERSERLRQLLSDLTALPERQRGALMMRELGGLDYEEIGRAFDSSPAAARQAAYEARVALQTQQQGRDMRCAEIKEMISSEDARRLRSKRVEAHLRSCEGCRDFAAAIEARADDLRMLFPALPAVAVSGFLAGTLGGGGAASGGGAGVATGGAASGGAAGVATGGVAAGGGSAAGIAAGGAGGGMVAKSVAVLAAGAIGIGGADATGIVDLPVGGGESADSSSRTASPAANENEGSAAPDGGATQRAAGAAADRGSSVDKGSAAARSGSKGNRAERSQGKRAGKAKGRPTRGVAGSGGSGKRGKSAGAPGRGRSADAPGRGQPGAPGDRRSQPRSPAASKPWSQAPPVKPGPPPGAGANGSGPPSSAPLDSSPSPPGAGAPDAKPGGGPPAGVGGGKPK